MIRKIRLTMGTLQGFNPLISGADRATRRIALSHILLFGVSIPSLAGQTARHKKKSRRR